VLAEAGPRRPCRLVAVAAEKSIGKPLRPRRRRVRG